MSPFDRAPTILLTFHITAQGCRLRNDLYCVEWDVKLYYTIPYHTIVTVALSRVVSEIYNVEKCRDLEIRVRGHSRSLKVVPSYRLGIVSY